MASIFTFDPDPPRLSSPWPEAVSSGRVTPAQNCNIVGVQSRLHGDITENEPELLEASSPLRIEAEPQEGPTEYKLHLLLRPRKSQSAADSVQHISGSQHSKLEHGSPRSISASYLAAAGPPSSSNVSRQHRLEQLTTQLLWRLQQSSPYHATSSSSLVLPALPLATPELQAPEQLAKLTPGLEESKGALYEIGVTDDGTLVGLTPDEMDESLDNLRAMAASLGCAVEVRRMICVGEVASTKEAKGKDGTVKLCVAEAFVKPVLHQEDERQKLLNIASTQVNDAEIQPPASRVEQLRVSLTGATTCGKSSLLGTLSTSTLDNGRGKSRLSLLKHRHEIASGVTSSVAQELLGYCGKTGDPSCAAQVLNYAEGNVSTWNDIHVSTDLFRLALLVDSAGHPRFRRTTVRGLVGWAPHWTFLCIAANEDAAEFGPVREEGGHPSYAPGFSGANAHISMAHLDLCLKLELPLVVIITKFDEAKKSSLRELLSTLLTVLKNAGRRPILISNSGMPVAEEELQDIAHEDYEEVRRLADQLGADPDRKIVPLLFTSAVKGTGIGKLHALLCCLPIPSTIDRNPASKTRSTFQIDDSFDILLQSSNNSSVISGYLTNGPITIGDILSLGPSSPGTSQSGSQNSPPLAPSDNDGPFLSPRSFTDALAKTTSSPRLRPSNPARDWSRVQVASIRNLRLSVHTLQPDQVGTIGIVALNDASEPLPPIRKGMVLTAGVPSAAHTFTARFAAEEASSVVVGSIVVIYCANVRAGARVVAVALDFDDRGIDKRYRLQQNSAFGSHAQSVAGSLDEGPGFLLDEELERRIEDQSSSVEEDSGDAFIRVTFQFVACREWIETGAKVLIMPSGGIAGDKYGTRGAIAGLEGFVGNVVETFE